MELMLSKVNLQSCCFVFKSINELLRNIQSKLGHYSTKADSSI